MIDISSLSNLLLYTTIRIIAIMPDGSKSIGTGFFFNYKIDQNHFLPVIITNKHVIKNAMKGEFFFHEALLENDKKIPSKNSFSFKMDGFKNYWIEFVNDIDLCALPLEILIEQAKLQNKEMFYAPFAENLVPSNNILEELSAIEDVKMVGYPIGLWDDTNNFPILRSGITATHPAIDFQGKPVGVIDMAAFPGSSGSPILIYNQGSYTKGTTINIGSRAYLIGILYAGPQLSVQGEIQIKEIPTSKIPISEMNIPVHLGYYIKTNILLENKAHILQTLKIL